MKTFRLFVPAFMLLITCKITSGQITFGNNPDATCVLNRETVYQFNASAIPDDETYSLLVERPGMTIHSSTGLISWTPADISDGGRVVVRVTNTGFSRTDTVLFYVSEGYQCDAAAISYWKFDGMDNSSYPDDYDGHDAQSAEPGHPANVAGKFDNAISIADANQGLTVTDHTDFHFGSNQSFSISFWFKSNIGDRDVTGVIMGRDEGIGYDKRHWWIGLDNNNQLFFLVRDNNYYDSYFNDSVCYVKRYGDKFYNNFDWHHVVCIRDASAERLKIYLDHDGSTPLHENAIRGYPASSDFFGATTAADLSIGNLSGAFPMIGTLDDLLILNRALTEQEVIDLYNQGIAGNPACEPGNSAPLFISEPDTVASEDQPYSYQMVAKDIDAGDILDYTPVNLPGWLSYTAANHTISGTPVNSDVGKVTVKVKVSDGTSEVIQQYDLNIKNVNDAPQITSSALTTVNEEQSYAYDVEVTDVDSGDVVTFSLTEKPAWLSINISTGVISGTAPLNDTGSYAVTVRATDVALAYDEQSFTIDIRNVNDAPAITGQNPLSVNEDNSLLIELSDVVYTDVDNPAEDITLTVISGSNYTFTGNTVSPAPDFSGALTVNIELSDLLTSSAGNLTVDVNPVNDRPEFTSSPVTAVNEDEPYTYNISYSDADAGDALTLSAVTVPSWLQLNAAQGTLTGIPTNDQVGTDPTASFLVKLKVSDGSLDSTQTFYVTVTNVNDPPEIIGQKDTVKLKANNSITLQLSNINVVDPDDADADLTLTILAGSNYTIAGNTVIVSNSAGLGYLPVNIRVSDPDNASDEGVYKLLVVITGIGETQYSSSLVKMIYPSPAKDHVVFDLTPGNRLTIEIYDMTGNLVIKETINKGIHQARFSTGQLAEGIYLFRVSIDDQYQTGSFAVSK